jgi:hypothetical protein
MKFNEKFWLELEAAQKAAQEKEYEAMKNNYDKLLQKNQKLEEQLKQKTVRATRPVDLRFTGLVGFPYEHQTILLSEHDEIVAQLQEEIFRLKNK